MAARPAALAGPEVVEKDALLSRSFRAWFSALAPRSPRGAALWAGRAVAPLAGPPELRAAVSQAPPSASGHAQAPGGPGSEPPLQVTLRVPCPWSCSVLLTVGVCGEPRMHVVQGLTFTWFYRLFHFLPPLN